MEIFKAEKKTARFNVAFERVSKRRRSPLAYFQLVIVLCAGFLLQGCPKTTCGQCGKNSPVPTMQCQKDKKHVFHQGCLEEFWNKNPDKRGKCPTCGGNIPSATGSDGPPNYDEAVRDGNSQQGNARTSKRPKGSEADAREHFMREKDVPKCGAVFAGKTYDTAVGSWDKVTAIDGHLEMRLTRLAECKWELSHFEDDHPTSFSEISAQVKDYHTAYHKKSIFICAVRTTQY